MDAEYRPYPPEDLPSFWGEAVEEAFAVPLELHRSFENDYELDGFVVETLRFRGILGQDVHGWIAAPREARRLPGFVWIPPYGRESKLPDAYGTRPGMVSLSFNFHGHSAFHQEKYVVERGYFGEGVGEPTTWIFRRMFQDAVIATRVLQAQVEVDSDRVAAMGMSQGGGIALWLGAWCPIIKAVCADMPFLGAMQQTLESRAYRYPLKELMDAMERLPLGRERVYHTLSYFDTMNQAGFCQVPTQVSVGLKDPACRPDTVRAIYEPIPARKRLKVYDWGHDWHPDMVSSNQEWLLENLL